MAGILQSNAQMGDIAQNFYDATAEQAARTAIYNIEAKAANRQELGYFLGRGISAGGQTLKDYRAGPAGDGGSKGSDGDASPGWETDLKGNTKFHPAKDFIKNFVDPYARYDHVRPLAGKGGLPMAPSRPGPLSDVNQHNAEVHGLLNQALIDPDFGSAVTRTGTGPD